MFCHLCGCTEVELYAIKSRRCGVDDTERGVIACSIYTNICRRLTVIIAHPCGVVGWCSPVYGDSRAVFALSCLNTLRCLDVIFHNDVTEVGVGSETEALPGSHQLVLRECHGVVGVLVNAGYRELTVSAGACHIAVVTTYFNRCVGHGVACNVLDSTTYSIERQCSHGDIKRCGGQLGDCGSACRIVIAQLLHLNSVCSLGQIAESVFSLGIRCCGEFTCIDNKLCSFNRFACCILHDTGDVTLVVFSNVDVVNEQSVVGCHVAAVVESHVVGRVFVHHGQVGAQRVYLSCLVRIEVELGDAVLLCIVSVL